MNCYILNLDDLEGRVKDNMLTEKIAPRYINKAKKMRSQSSTLAALGVGLLLAKYLNITDDEALSIDKYGKPFLTDKSAEISISHAGNLVVLAVSDCAVGVDVEPFPVIVDRCHMFALKRAYGNKIETEGNSCECLKPQRFCELWTRVEAAVKLDGRGLRVDPRKNPQILEGISYRTFEYKNHIITVATYEARSVEIIPCVL